MNKLIIGGMGRSDICRDTLRTSCFYTQRYSVSHVTCLNHATIYGRTDVLRLILGVMDRNPYQPDPIAWSLIDNWEQLDFVKALPESIKKKLREYPAEAEVEPKWVYNMSQAKMVPHIDPEKSRAHWLRIYNEQYKPEREKKAKFAELAAQKETADVIMRNLAHISELMERLVQTNREVLERVKTITESAVLYKDINGPPF